MRTTDDATPAAAPPPGQIRSFEEEMQAIGWIHGEVRAGRLLPALEARTVVRLLYAAMHADRQPVLPLLRPRDFGEYPVIHALNVAMLSMALAERIGREPHEARIVGLAGLLHNVGEVRLPPEVLTKPGELSAEERELISHHPATGARILLESDEDLAVAAVVAYEHHMTMEGAGYPTPTFPRASHPASRLIRICDVFDALRAPRPFRDTWPLEEALRHIDEQAGHQFDPELAHAFTAMIRGFGPRLLRLEPSASPRQAAPPAD